MTNITSLEIRNYVRDYQRYMKESVRACPHCKEQMRPFFAGAYKGGYLNKKLNIFSQRPFCSKECYEDYIK